MEINTKVHEPEEMAELFSRIIGKPVGAGFGLFPPFYTDFGKNIIMGRYDLTVSCSSIGYPSGTNNQYLGRSLGDFARRDEVVVATIFLTGPWRTSR